MTDLVRTALLRAHEDVQTWLAEVAPLVNAAGPDTAAYISLEDALFWRGEELRDAYLRSLPPRAISRCPFTDELVVIRIDTVDLDGLWWNTAAPIRRTLAAPLTYLGLTGALRIGGSLPDAPFPIEPGPAAPYVLPAALMTDGVIAALSTVPVGAHTGYAIAYFSKSPVHPGLLAASEWGAFDGLSNELDFDLAPWIERGKLRWIAPDDPGLRLHSDIEGCPYLAIRGSRVFQRVERGVQL
ncbi:MAG: hypothetical protein NVS9B11_18730 [Candidatus Dormibacteraceae bacterium]